MGKSKLKAIEHIELQGLILYMNYEQWKLANPEDIHTPLRCLQSITKQYFGEDRNFVLR